MLSNNALSPQGWALCANHKHLFRVTMTTATLVDAWSLSDSCRFNPVRVEHRLGHKKGKHSAVFQNNICCWIEPKKMRFNFWDGVIQAALEVSDNAWRTIHLWANEWTSSQEVTGSKNKQIQMAMIYFSSYSKRFKYLESQSPKPLFLLGPVGIKASVSMQELSKKLVNPGELQIKTRTHVKVSPGFWGLTQVMI